MSVEVANESGVDVDVHALSREARFLLDRLRLHPAVELSVVLVDEPAMTELHVKWMDEPGPTDVLSFPMDELRAPKDDEEPDPGLLGDIVICPQVAARQAVAAGHTTEQELAMLLAHGLLHLLGHDHAEPDEHRVMFGLQGELLVAWDAAEQSGAAASPGASPGDVS